METKCRDCGAPLPKGRVLCRPCWIAQLRRQAPRAGRAAAAAARRKAGHEVTVKKVAARTTDLGWARVEIGKRSLVVHINR